MGPDGLHPKMLRELVDVVAKPLSVILQQTWLAGNVLADWRLANAMPIFKKGRKDDPGSYRPISLTSVSGKVMEQNNLGNHHGPIKGQPGDQAQSAWVYKW